MWHAHPARDSRAGRPCHSSKLHHYFDPGCFSSEVLSMLFLLSKPPPVCRTLAANPQATTTEVNYAQNPKLSKSNNVNAGAWSSAPVGKQRVSAYAELER